MNFEWTIEEAEIKKRTAEVLAQPAPKEIEAMEDADQAGLKNLTLQFLKRLAEAGYTSLALGPAASGEIMSLVAAQEEPALVSGSLFLAVETSVRAFGGLLAGFGPAGLGEDILDTVRAGEALGAVAVAEPGGAEPTAESQTTGRAEGGGFVVDGKKSFVTNGPLADWLAVSGTIEGQPAFFLVKPGQEGLVMGPRLKTLGYNGLAVCSLELVEVRVPADLVLGPFEDDAALVYLDRVQNLALTTASLGLTKRALDQAHAHARSHHRGDKPIFAHQEVRFKLADMFTLYQTAKLLLYRAAWFAAQRDREADSLLACAKVFAAEAAEKTSNLAMQILAGQAYLAGNPVEKAYREAKYAALAGLTSEKARMAIADEVLRRTPA